jgi:integrase
MTPFKDSNDEDSTREMDFYTIEEFNYFIRNVPDFLYKCLFKTLFYCGLRNGEMRGIRWSRIDWKEKKIKILSQIPTKYSSRKFKETTLKTRTSKRILPIANDLYDDLKKLYEETKQKYSNFDDEWFVFGDILPMVADNPHLYQERVCKNIKLRVIRIHDFRHSCASLLINSGANVTIVAKYLGHAKIDETLNTYSHIFDNKMDEIVDTINKLNDKS